MKTQKTTAEGQGDEKGRLFQAVAYYCRTLPTGSNTTTGQIRRIVEVLEEIHWLRCTNRNIFLAEPPELSPKSFPPPQCRSVGINQK